jgi:hypothetical protein
VGRRRRRGSSSSSSSSSSIEILHNDEKLEANNAAANWCFNKTTAVVLPFILFHRIVTEVAYFLMIFLYAKDVSRVQYLFSYYTLCSKSNTFTTAKISHSDFND